MRVSILVFASLLTVSPVVASDGGGGGGGGGAGGEGGGGVMAGGAPPAPAAPRGAAPRAGGGSSTLPGGGQITLAGPPGNRDVTVTTADGKTFTGKHISTKRNPKTGITSVFIRNADGSRTGVHVDAQGNTAVSNHKR